MRIGHTELFVRDPVASRDFYERVLGFEVAEVQHGGAVVWLRMGGREILLRKDAPPAATTVPAVRHPRIPTATGSSSSTRVTHGDCHQRSRGVAR